LVFAQLSCYMELDKRGLPKWKILVFFLAILIAFFALPFIYQTVYGDNDVRCKTPLVGLVLFFWLFGGGSILLTHFVFLIFRYFRMKKDTLVKGN